MAKNFWWSLSLSVVGMTENKEYLSDNIEGKLPLFMKEAGFHIKENNRRYHGVQFLLGEKIPV